jgi:uncharacterized DUF497 family protein
MRFDGFDWDKGNLAKCAKHGVSMREIEATLRGSPVFSPDEAHSGTEQRYVAAGRTPEDRAVFVAFTLRERNGAVLLRPVSARYMHMKEAARYGRQRAH